MKVLTIINTPCLLATLTQDIYIERSYREGQ